MRNGQFADSFSLHPDFFDTQSSLLLYKLLGATFVNISELTIDQDIRIKFLDYMMDFYRLHLIGFGKVKSLSVLHDVFRD